MGLGDLKMELSGKSKRFKHKNNTTLGSRVMSHHTRARAGQAAQYLHRALEGVVVARHVSHNLSLIGLLVSQKV